VSTRNVWLTAVLLVITTVSLEVMVYGAEITWLNVESVFFRILFSPFYVLVVMIGSGVCGALGLWLADRKLRSSAEGLLLGVLLGPLGVLIEAALPDLREYPQPRWSEKKDRRRI
jgi:hypothetical protein